MGRSPTSKVLILKERYLYETSICEMSKPYPLSFKRHSTGQSVWKVGQGHLVKVSAFEISKLYSPGFERYRPD